MFRFTLIDFTNDKSGIATVVEEPVGWDAITIRLKREDKVGWHGFFEFFDDGITSLEFYNSGFQILKSAYESFGVEAKVDLLIEYKCVETGDFEFLYQGSFAFKRAKFFCGLECYVSIGVESSDCLMKFRNRYEQKVDLDSLIPSDEFCYDTQSNTTGAFIAPNTIILSAPYPALKQNATFSISGTTLNNGDYTVSDIEINFSNQTIITVSESVVDEFPTGVTIQGCIEFFRLQNYSGLGFNLTLPSKKILNEGFAKNTDGYSINFDNDFTGLPTIIGVPNNARLNAQSTFNLPAVKEDLNRVNGQTQTTYCTDVTCSPVDYLPIYEFDENANIKCSANTLINLKIEGTYIDNYESEVIPFPNNFKLRLVKGATLSSAVTILSYSHTYSKSQYGIETHNFSWVETDQVVNFVAGEKLWLYIGLNLALGNGALSFVGSHNVTINPGSFFSIKIQSQCLPTQTKSYFINEVFSRLAENYTNDCLRVYSEYFGRTDSQPYNTNDDGCGSNEIITNGLLIRNASLTDGQEPSLKVSFKETFEAMKAIHNIGMGLEDDTERIGFKRLRIEPYKYFYKDDVLFVLENPNQVKKSVKDSFVNTIKIGYQKWEAEETNGLYDLFGNREYKTVISAARGSYEQLSKFIASDYAIEVTRRKFGTTSKDWKYDNDTFIICVQKGLFIECANFVLEDPVSGLGNLLNVGSVADGSFQVGDSITITGSSSNNFTYTIDSVLVLPFNPPVTTLILSGNSVTDESCANITIINNTRSLVTTEIYDVSEPSTIENVLLPKTAFNLRITPIRNLLRHYPSIAESLSRSLDSALYFTDGNGNIKAKINLAANHSCVLESNKLISENQNISIDDFQDNEFRKPLCYNEDVEIEYPINQEQFKAVISNPYGLIGWNCGNGVIEYGWIMDMKYQPTTGMTEFILKPKIQN